MAKQYTYQDTQRPDGCYITFERVELLDDCSDRPDERDDGFWPSTDPEAAGYIGPDGDFAEQRWKAQHRLLAWQAGEWSYIGIRARAHIFTVQSGMGKHSTLESAGIWGIESDSDKGFLDEVYQDQVQALKDEIEAMQNAIYEV